MEQALSELKTQTWLAEYLPTWQVHNGIIKRVFKTGSWRLTMMVANSIAYLAEAADHHPNLLLSYTSVEIHLETHSAGGITNKDLELAQKIEETITWYPAANNALDGAKKENWLKPDA
ncbi:MAG: 4a-hydroxytetrahydrobiopterin dehydratase [Caldilineaceae bacterium]|nr:4a-hydroxytetrahydrobiopterin dehydratase [Caldilineaceae bacterium]